MLNKPRMLTPGPTPLPENVRLAMAQDMIHHRKAEFKGIMEETQKNLRLLFGTALPVIPLASVGTGAMTAAVTNLFAAGETVIVIEGGKFGERWTEIATHSKLNVITLKVEWGKSVSVDAVAKILAEHPEAAGLFVQCSETSTGAMHPVREIAALTRKTNTLLVVDGVSSVGISPCPMDEWGLDCLLTGSQKGLMLPPGMSLIALSDRAWKKAETLTPSCYYFDLIAERKNILQNQTRFTTPVSLIIGLHKSLEMFMETGLETVYRKQWALTSMVRAGVKALGLELYAEEGYAWGVTSIKLPAGVDGQALIAHAAKEYSVIFAGGQDHLKGRIVRMGHMGWVDFGDVCTGLFVLAESLRACGGYSACRDYLEQALSAYQHALQNYDTENSYAEA